MATTDNISCCSIICLLFSFLLTSATYLPSCSSPPPIAFSPDNGPSPVDGCLFCSFKHSYVLSVPPSASTWFSPSLGLSVVFHIKKHLFRQKKWRRLIYGIGTSNEPVPAPPPPPLDKVFLGKYRVTWTIGGFREKLRWRYREMKTPPLKTSRFSLAHYRGLQLKLWPDGHRSSKQGFMSIALYQPEHWEQIEDDINLFIGDQKRGPFKHLSPEYEMASRSFCRVEDLNIVNDQLEVGVEISAI
eukprot:GHVS01020703.1.p1 GENE.GHVS01020703.1~~GHVS01020703.1.p1  ORF type:complete len:261 (-),score=50.06 GHVS01020703.1:587-1318(-)